MDSIQSRMAHHRIKVNEYEEMKKNYRWKPPVNVVLLHTDSVNEAKLAKLHTIIVVLMECSSSENIGSNLVPQRTSDPDPELVQTACYFCLCSTLERQLTPTNWEIFAFICQPSACWYSCCSPALAYKLNSEHVTYSCTMNGRWWKKQRARLQSSTLQRAPVFQCRVKRVKLPS